MTPHPLLPALINIAQDAGACIMAIYQSSFSVTEKADASPLTQADQASHALICERLRELTPHIPIISEESALPDAQHRLTWETLWLVDPLDGTKEFIKHSGEFTVNIALIQRHEPVLGIILAPAKSVLYYGIREGGAYRVHGTNGTHQPITCRAWPTSAPSIWVESRDHATAHAHPLLDRQPHQRIALGSSLKFGWIAEGKADGYLRMGPTCEWDTAAGQALVEAAGGRVLDHNGQPLRYNTKETLINPHFIVLGDATVNGSAQTKT